MKKPFTKLFKIKLKRYYNFLKFINKFDIADLENLKDFVYILSKLRLKSHINDFSNIHEIYLTTNWNNRNINNLVNYQYQPISNVSDQRQVLKQKEFKVSSQNGEDGIILYLLSLIGTTSKKFVDIGCGGATSNTYNLAINYGFSGLYIDGNINNINQSREIITHATKNDDLPIHYLSSWVTKENIDEIIKSCKLGMDIDILSIDIDGNDYWIWDAIKEVRPRLVVIEYNASFGCDLSLTIQYNEDFNALDYHDRKWYHGASLKALKILGQQKGYKLVGCESNGVNAFFIREDVLPDQVSEVEVVDAYYTHFNRINIKSLEEQIRFLKSGFPLIEI